MFSEGKDNSLYQMRSVFAAGEMGMCIAQDAATRSSRCDESVTCRGAQAVIGRTVSRYRILSKLGGGGMGVVYEAEDTELGRRVAMKFLPEDTAESPEALDRFKREARAASALNHPHICTVYDIGVHDGKPFLVMERMQGTTLKHTIDGKPLPIEQVVSLGAQIADALDAAHRAGIVHRDLKPANLFVTERGEAKILDFGLAKIGVARERRGADTGRPDNGRGPPHLSRHDARYSGLHVAGAGTRRAGGCAKRSLLVGRGAVRNGDGTCRRSRAATLAMIFDGILHREVPPPSRSNPEVPRELDSVILGALEKERNLRVQSAAELRAALKRLMRGSAARSVPSAGRPTGAAITARPYSGDRHCRARGEHRRRWILGVRRGGAPAREIASIAVLPFADMSQARDQEYFSDGLSEELLDVLAKISQLRVIGRTSSFQFKGKNEDLRAIAEKLGVDHLLEGSVRKEGNRVRITAQLIRASDGSHLWSETYDRTLDDVFKVQDEIADAVAQAMKVTLLVGRLPERKRAREQRSAQPRTSKGSTSSNVGRGTTTRKPSCRSTERLAADREFAPAWAGLAWVYALQAGLGVIPAESGSKQARDAAQRALGLDSKLVEAHTAMVYILTGYDWDWAGADAEVQQVLALDPGNADALYSAGLLARTLGRFDEAISFYQRAMARDPLSAGVHNNLGLALYYAGRLPEAEAQLRKLLELQARDRSRARSSQQGAPRAWTARGRARRDREGAFRSLADDRPAARLPRTWAQGRVRRGAPRAHAKIRGRMGVSDRRGARVPRRDRRGLRMARSRVRPARWRLLGNEGRPTSEELESDPRYDIFVRKVRLPIQAQRSLNAAQQEASSHLDHEFPGAALGGSGSRRAAKGHLQQPRSVSRRARAGAAAGRVRTGAAPRA